MLNRLQLVNVAGYKNKKRWHQFYDLNCLNRSRTNLWENETKLKTMYGVMKRKQYVVKWAVFSLFFSFAIECCFIIPHIHTYFIQECARARLSNTRERFLLLSIQGEKQTKVIEGPFHFWLAPKRIRSINRTDDKYRVPIILSNVGYTTSYTLYTFATRTLTKSATH